MTPYSSGAITKTGCPECEKLRQQLDRLQQEMKEKIEIEKKMYISAIAYGKRVARRK